MSKDTPKNVQPQTEKNNAELIEIYRNDQADRQVDNIDWNVISKRDRLREARIYQL